MTLKQIGAAVRKARGQRSISEVAEAANTMHTPTHTVTLDHFLTAIASPLVRCGALDAPEPQALAVRALRGEWRALTGRELSEGQARRILASAQQTLNNG